MRDDMGWGMADAVLRELIATVTSAYSEGEQDAELWAKLRELGLSDLTGSDARGGSGAGSGADAGAVEPTAPGRVHLRASGALAQILGESAVLELDLPVGVRSVLAQAALRWPAAAPLLEKEGAVLPGVHLAGRQLGPRDLVRDRDELDLVLVVSGG